MPAEITRAVNAGCDELGGIAYDVKRATVVAWLEKFYKERGKPESNIPVGTELDVANAELRTILTWARARRKEIMARDGNTDKDVASMTKVTSLIASTEKAIRESKVMKDQERVDAGKTTKRPDKGILSQIAKAEQEARRLAPSASAEPAPSSKPEDQPPDTPASDSAPLRAQGNDDPFGTSGVGYPD